MTISKSDNQSVILDMQAKISQILGGFRQGLIEFDEAVGLLESYFQKAPSESRREFFKLLWLDYLKDPISEATSPRAVHGVIIRAWASFGPTEDLARVMFSQGWENETQTKLWVVMVGPELLHSLWTYRARFSKAALDRLKAECAPFLTPQYEQLFGVRLPSELFEFIKRLDKGLDKITFERSVADLKSTLQAGQQGSTEAGAPQPEQMDDLLPLFRKAQFQPDLKRLVAAASHVSPLGLLVIDFDEFAKVNEFGHPVGDEVLVGTATAIKAVCEGKGRCYRWGGDEFAVLLPNHSSAEANAVAERIRATVAEVKFAGYPQKATLSIGIASYPATFTSTDEFFKAADDAVLAAKKSGRDCIVMSATASEKIVASSAATTN